MRNFAGIMFRQTGAQIIGDTDVEVLRIETLENVDVLHRGSS